MFKFYIIFLCFFLSLELQAKESLLTLSQQLERLQREVNDLSVSVNKGQDKNNSEVVKNLDETSNLTVFDLRIYDLEKDIKMLNQNFEELIFQIDDLKEMYEELNTLNSTKLLMENKNQITVFSEDSTITLLENKKNENTLGTLVIKSEDLTVSSEKNSFEEQDNDTKQNITSQTTVELKPEEEFQKAFDMMRNQRFSEAKKALEDFINKYKNNKLVGSAHYWLGEMYLIKKEYREAALIFAEGYQKFPNSFKAPDMLFKLSDSFINIDKKKNSCTTLEKLILEFPENKLAFKAEKKLISLNCIISE